MNITTKGEKRLAYLEEHKYPDMSRDDWLEYEILMAVNEQEGNDAKNIINSFNIKYDYERNKYYDAFDELLAKGFIGKE